MKTVLQVRAAIVTPACRRIYPPDELARLIDVQIDGGTDAIIICGTTGESFTSPIRSM